MSIHFEPGRWDRIRDSYSRWWSGELERPLVAVTLHGFDPDRDEPEIPAPKGRTAHWGRNVPPETIVDRWDYDLSTQRFAGDAFPQVFPDFGPGVIAAFLGARPEADENTVWFHPPDDRPIADLRLTFNPDHEWLQRITDIMRAANERWQGAVQVGMTDLGGNLDILSSFRPGEKLLLDLYDQSEDVKRVTWEAHEAWWKYYDVMNAVLQPVNPGYTAWCPIFSPTPYYMLQCDFCYMIGPDMFDEFVKPELSATCRRLGNAFYHLDGVGQLAHLDSLLSIPELKGIQWVPGAGQPDMGHWPDVYRKIRDAGKLIQVYSTASHGLRVLDVLNEQLGTAKGVLLIGWSDGSQQEDVRELLRDYGAE